jgi:Family of unknown function (DUF5947)
MNVERPEFETPFEALRQFVRRRRPAERCELCSQELGPEHAHLLELAKHRLLCSCEGCALLFGSQSNRRYKRVPRRIQLLRDFQMSEAHWEGLLIPINMAFFFKSSLPSTVTALYPSPAGATESLLTLDSWSDIVARNPVLREMESDVEALLVNRVAQAHGAGPGEYYLLPIDECYRLVGIIRRHWRGLSGGTEVWQEIAAFFHHLRAKATVAPRESYA